MNGCLVMVNGRYRFAGSEYMELKMSSRFSSSKSLKNSSLKKDRNVASSTSLKSARSNKSIKSLQKVPSSGKIEKAGGRIFLRGVVTPV